MLMPLTLERDRPLQQQLYAQLRDLIASGRLSAGARMPSTRLLAEEYSISRITVILTYERLIAEGWLYTLPANGTFVGALLPGTAPAAEGATQAPAAVTLRPPDNHAVGQPDPELFPLGRWHAALRHALDRLGPKASDGGLSGLAALRQNLAEWICATRGLAVAPEQILIVSGRRRALELIARLFLRPGMRAVVEMPCDSLVSGAYAAAGARLLRVPVDGDGLLVERLQDAATALAHVTPGHQKPLGVTLRLERRLRLLEWAERAGAIIIEEDHDADFRNDPATAKPLASIEGGGPVIHLGSVATAMGPYLSLAYLVFPPHLVGAAAQLVPEEESGGLEQAALAEFIGGGAFARHVHRARKTYAARRHALTEARQQHFPQVRLFGADAGLYQAWVLPPELGPASRFAAAARACGLHATDLSESGGASGGLDQHVVLMDVARCPEKRVDAMLDRLGSTFRGLAGKQRLSQTAD
jgi:GntR family transcriptional regulator / MocR family aminotransferase